MAEGLSHLINKANNNGSLSGFVCPNGPTISHLLFTDDSVIFCKAEERELLNLKNILKIYEIASVESINYSKSAILFPPKLNIDRKVNLSSILGVNGVNNFGNYLGVPSMFSTNKSKDLSFILDKTWKVVQGWKNSFFSIAGRETLIKSVGQTIPSYVMGVFRFPKNLCNEITRNFARFWWGSSPNKRKVHWVKWDKMCLPKIMGGLNFRDLEGFNKALIAKQVWRILTNPESLVSRFLKSIYFNNTNILEAELGRKPSNLWRSLIWGRELLLKGLRHRIGNGVDTAMFRDPWLSKELTFKPTCINWDMINWKVADFILPSGD